MKKVSQKDASPSGPVTDAKAKKKKVGETSDVIASPKRTRADAHQEEWGRRSSPPSPPPKRVTVAEKEIGEVVEVTDLTLEPKWNNSHCHCHSHILKLADARLLIEHCPEASIEAIAACALRISVISQFWSQETT